MRSLAGWSGQITPAMSMKAYPQLRLRCYLLQLVGGRRMRSWPKSFGRTSATRLRRRGCGSVHRLDEQVRFFMCAGRRLTGFRTRRRMGRTTNRSGWRVHQRRRWRTCEVSSGCRRGLRRWSSLGSARFRLLGYLLLGSLATSCRTHASALRRPRRSPGRRRRLHERMGGESR